MSLSMTGTPVLPARTIAPALWLLATAVAAQPANAPGIGSPWRPQASPTTVELRGLAVVDDAVAWASGARGTILRTLDGESWLPVAVPGAEALDFRDVEAWDERHALALSIGPGEASSVYKTTDGGATWRRVLQNSEETGFWDALAFWDPEHGAVFGDPVRGRFQVLVTADGGESWQPVPEQGMPPALENEGGFAASGSCLVAGPDGRLAFVTGGAAEARVFVSTDRGGSFAVSTSPVPAGAASMGLFSVAWLGAEKLIAVGGDYRRPDLEGLKASLSLDGGARWRGVRAEPGFLSSVVRGPGGEGSVVAVGLAGTGMSHDGGITWSAIDATPFNVVAFAPGSGSGTAAGWAAGPGGTLARWVGLPKPEP